MMRHADGVWAGKWPWLAGLAATLVAGLLVVPALLAPQGPDGSGRPAALQGVAAPRDAARRELPAAPGQAGPLVQPVRLAAAAAFDGQGDDFTSPEPEFDPPIPGTERAHYAEFRSRIAQPGVDIHALVVATVVGDVPDSRKVALLRALCDAGSPQAIDALVFAAANARACAGPHGESVPYFAIAALADRAADDPAARAGLESLLRPADGGAAAGAGVGPDAWLRRLAAARLALTGTEQDLTALAADIRGSTDPSLLLGVARGLKHNPEAASVRQLFNGLPEIPDDDVESPGPGD